MAIVEPIGAAAVAEVMMLGLPGVMFEEPGAWLRLAPVLQPWATVTTSHKECQANVAVSVSWWPDRV